MEYFVAKDKSVPSLTPREIEILSLLTEGYTTQQIGEILNISERTTQTHHSRIMLKLSTHYLPGLEQYAIQYNLATTTSNSNSDAIISN